MLCLERLALREIVLRPLSDPNTALIAAVLGMFLIYWELVRPGSVIPGATGAVLLILGLRSLTVTRNELLPTPSIAFPLLTSWGIVTAFLVSTGIRARRNKWVEHPSERFLNSPIDASSRALYKGADRE